MNFLNKGIPDLSTSTYMPSTQLIEFVKISIRRKRVEITIQPSDSHLQKKNIEHGNIIIFLRNTKSSAYM